MTLIRDQEAGVTLIEMLVALSLFALVGIASFTTLDTILRVRERTDGRLEHLAQLDRALLVFGRDIVQADPRTVTLRDGVLSTLGHDGQTRRQYLHDANTLSREIGPRNADDLLRQTLILDVSALTFRVLDRDRNWHSTWPLPDSESEALAVDMRVDIDGIGSLRRLSSLTRPAPR